MFFFSALKKIKVSIAAVFTYFIVISSTIWGAIFFKETITWDMLMGGFLILSSASITKG
jgi:drug/metabolite transporter (DMT)-like permease